MSNQNTIPTTLLTGFLGSGKTTLVNRLLSQNHGRKLMVLVNEFGAIGVDADLIVNDRGTVIEMANGCVCCTTQGDLKRVLRDVAPRPGIEGVLIETSGLADPEPVIAEFDDGELERHYRLDSVISVIDSDNFDRNLDQAEAAYQQIVCADLLVINKTDLVAPGIIDQIAAGLRKLNPAAPQIRTKWCEVGMDLIVGGAEPQSRTASSGHHHDHGDGHHHHHSGFASMVIEPPGLLGRVDLSQWIEALPRSIFRVKGFVRLRGQSGLATVHVVGARHLVESSHLKDSASRLVLIGNDETDLRRAVDDLQALVDQGN